MNIRQYVRVPIRCIVECEGDDFFAEGSVTNLSLGGWTIESAQPVHQGMTLRLRVFLPDEEKPLTVKQTTVQWSGKGKFGLKTIFIEEEDKKRLQRFIVTYVNKPSRKAQE